MTFTARDMVARLHDVGFLDAVWGDTGGGVYNVVFAPVCQHGVMLGEVRASDNGEWGSGDVDSPCESVSVMAYGPDGAPVGDPFRVDDMRGFEIAWDALCYSLESFCAACRDGE